MGPSVCRLMLVAAAFSVGRASAAAAPSIEALDDGSLVLHVLAGQKVYVDAGEGAGAEAVVTETALAAAVATLRADFSRELTATNERLDDMDTASKDDDSVAKLGKTLKGEIDAVLAAVGKLEQKQNDLTASDKAQADCHADRKLYDASSGKCVLAVQVSCGDTVPATKGRPPTHCGGDHFAGDVCNAKCPAGWSGADAKSECGLDGVWRYASGSGGLATCTDIDECKAGTHNCKAGADACRNTPGSFECVSTGDMAWTFDFNANQAPQGWTGKNMWGPSSNTDSISNVNMPNNPKLRPGWTSSFNKATALCATLCKADKQRRYLGGTCLGAGSTITSPDFVLSRATKTLFVKFTFVVDKSWDREAAFLTLNGQRVWQQVHEYHWGFKGYHGLGSPGNDIGTCGVAEYSSKGQLTSECANDPNCAGYTVNMKGGTEIPDCKKSKISTNFRKTNSRVYVKVKPEAGHVHCDAGQWWTNFVDVTLKLDCSLSLVSKTCKFGMWDAGTKLQFQFGTKLNSGPGDEAWGIQTFAVAAQ